LKLTGIRRNILLPFSWPKYKQRKRTVCFLDSSFDPEDEASYTPEKTANCSSPGDVTKQRLYTLFRNLT
jgi:hypothetical protein